MDTRTFHKEVMKKVLDYDMSKMDCFFSFLDGGNTKEQSYYDEIYQKTSYPCYFYSYLACAVRTLRAIQVVEFGADMGVSTLMMASEGAKVYSVDINSGWELVPEGYDKIVKITGASVNYSLFEGVNLGNTDLWLFDAAHTDIAVTSEFFTYNRHFKKGSILIFDDIDLYPNFWSLLNSDKLESKDVHGGNVGIVCVKS